MEENQSGMKSSANLGALLDFSFSKLITISIIKFIYGLMLAMIALGWLIMTIGSLLQSVVTGLLVGVVGLLVAILYAIMARVSLEIVVVIFKIGENVSILASREKAK